ncbi:sulfatase [Nocardioides conyzicola]|uniref:Sulfatase n=1 Tax=Nocardioides conyzicola TaxID=1651781 RepID=A0ABP8XBR0_9ACTN
MSGPGRQARRRRLTAVITATAALAGWAAASSVHAQPAPPPAADERPNVVMITLDDLAEGDLAVMPRTRELIADQGTTMTQGIAPTPICAPARASLLTGQYAHNHGVLTIEGEAGGFRSFNDRRTLPTWLKKAGYETMFAGKYLNGYGVNNPRYIPPGWDRWRASIDFTTYSFLHTKFNVDGKVVKPPGYSSDILARYTEDLLAQHRHGRLRDDPFFLWVNYVAPHHGGPRESDDPGRTSDGRRPPTTTPAPRDRNHFRHRALPREPDMWEQDLRGNPHAGPVAPRSYRAAIREVYQQRLESLLAVDRAVGRTVAALRRSGELKRTVIILTSDNGYMVGQHDLVGKLWFYDKSVRIPIVMRGPGIPAGKRVSTPITNPDLAVTIAGLARARPTRKVDGVDLLPWLDRPDQRRAVPIEAYPVKGGHRRLYSGIRYGDLTYVRSRNGFEELYDRARDPGELVNVARRPAYRSTLKQLRRWDRRYRDCAGSSCPRGFEAAG